MFDHRLKDKNPLYLRLTIACGLACLLIASSAGPLGASDGVTLDTGFFHMYNLDFAGAHKTFETWQELHPEDPIGPASNAAAYLFSEFDRMRILELGLFTDDRLEKAAKIQPDVQIKAAFESQLAKASMLAEKVLSQTPDDENALFAKVLSDGLRADYTALVERRMKEGLKFLKLSRSTAERLISIDPSYHDAYLALGIENYILGLRAAPTRWMLRLSGAQTSKNKGIANLRITAEKGRYLAPYARVLLAIAALRDEDKSTARKLLAELSHEFPQNRLYQNELARLRN